MRKNLDPLKDEVGLQRTIEKFLWFPKVVSGELRWLENSKIRQEVINVDVGGSMEYGNNRATWVDIAWANK